MNKHSIKLLALGILAVPLARGEYQLVPEVAPPGTHIVAVYAANSSGNAIGRVTTNGSDSQPVVWLGPNTPQINKENLGGGPAVLLGLAPAGLAACGYAPDKRGIINAVMADNDDVWPVSFYSTEVSHIFGVCNAIRVDSIRDNLIIGVGETQDTDGYIHAAYWWNPGGGTMGDLGGHYSSATALTSEPAMPSGPTTPYIAGFAALGSGHVHAVIWKWYHYDPVDLGTLNGGANSYAFGINDSIEIVGSSEVADVDSNGAPHLHATQWRSPAADAITDLGTLPNGLRSSAESINNAGQIVGQSDAGDGLSHAVLWQGGKIYDLNQVFAGLLPAGVVLTDAPSIASNGLIQVNGHNTVTGEQVFYQAKAVTRTAVGITSSSNPAYQGHSVTFTATVVPVTYSPIAVLPGSGSVTFKDGLRVLARVALTASNVAHFSTDSLALGKHTITASYSGSDPFLPSNSPILTQSIILHAIPLSAPDSN